MQLMKDFIGDDELYDDKVQMKYSELGDARPIVQSTKYNEKIRYQRRIR